jgi:hypothetical protein
MISYWLINYNYRRGDVVTNGRVTWLVLGVVKSTWWRRLLTRLGFNMHIGETKMKVICPQEKSTRVKSSGTAKPK